MELSTTREPASCVATRLFPSILWNPKVHYRVHSIPLRVSILSQFTSPHSICAITILLFSTHLELDHLSSRFPSGFPSSKLYMFLFPNIRATCPAHLIHINLITLIILGVMQVFPPSRHFIPPPS
jgi:hypothetical protein